DSENGKIQIISKEGHPITSFSVKGKNESYPVGIVKIEREIYVSDLEGGKILVFKENGRFVKEFAQDKLIKPLGLSFFKDRLFVTDIGDHSVKVFNLKGDLLFKIGSFGDKKGTFAFPNAVATDGERIFVSDSNNQRVQVFDKKGKFLKVFNYPLKLPRGITLDNFSRVHVVDAFAQSVFVFDKEGNFLFNYGDFDSGECYLPNGIAIDESMARIYVTNRNGTISVFSYEK
ncbi:MAG: hypothetical protein Q8M92_09745, partial [Candidatus Subteraquimicrobiales bacterium]|nr:hypothetical protein [Candidatus Subteraquimicrobiales bacterium]